ncbi:MAG: elongation factor G, partial [Myxococcales bacterium]|nr:elongation factor G [Myxococcales bacterium]
MTRIKQRTPTNKTSPLARASKTRNFGIVAHVDAGKTTLTERILYQAGLLHRVGEVHDGNTVTDSDPLERKKGITINAASVSCEWRTHRLQLVDTPGHVDFGAEVELSLRVLDSAVVVLDAVAGVEPQTESVWRQADRYRLPRLCFVNKLDRAGSDFERAVSELEAHFGVRCVVVTKPELFPDGIFALYKVLDDAWVGRPIGPDHRPPSIHRERAIETLANFDDEVARLYLEETEVPGEVLRRALRDATLAGHVVPVLGGAAYKNLGVPELLDAIVDYLPAPDERPAVVGSEPSSGASASRERSDEEPLAGLVLKKLHDGFGQLALVRLYAGRLRAGDKLWTSQAPRGARVGRLVRVFADRQTPIEVAHAGDIVGVGGLELAPGDTISSLEAPIELPRPVLPEPVVRVALSPNQQSDVERLGVTLARLTQEDPALRLETDPETGQTLLAGIGELHIEVAVERLRERYRTEVKVGPPRVAYREALTQEVRHEFKLSKQSGGPGQYAHVVLLVGPASPGTGLDFEDQSRGGVVPSQYVPAVRAGVEAAMTSGPLLGYPIEDARVVLVDGSSHSNDSNDFAFRLAAQKAFREAASLAGPVLREPLMRLEVLVPESHLGDVIGDLSRRRGQVLELGEKSGVRCVSAVAPLAELFGYAGSLRSLSQGRGSFNMRLDSYAEVPALL